VNNSKCWSCSNSTNIWYFAVYVALCRHSWKGCHFLGPPSNHVGHRGRAVVVMYGHPT